MKEKILEKTNEDLLRESQSKIGKYDEEERVMTVKKILSSNTTPKQSINKRFYHHTADHLNTVYACSTCFKTRVQKMTEIILLLF